MTISSECVCVCVCLCGVVGGDRGLVGERPKSEPCETRVQFPTLLFGGGDAVPLVGSCDDSENLHGDDSQNCEHHDSDMTGW